MGRQGRVAQDLRDVTAKIRAIELFNPVGLPRLPTPSRPLPFTLSPSDLGSSLFVSPFVPLFSARSMSCSLCHAPCSLLPAPAAPLAPSSSSVPRLSASSAASGSRALRSFVTAPLFALSHSICHPPSFHHPSKPYGLTGGTRRVASACVGERREASSEG